MGEATRGVRAVAVAVLAGFLSFLGWPAAAVHAEGEPAFALRTLQLEGVTVFREGDLSPLLEHLIGRDVTLSQLEEAADAVAAFYRARGYPFASAYVPPQEVSDGVVVIAVEEGRYGSVVIENESRLRDETVQNLLGPVRPGAVVEAQSLTWAMRRLDGAAGVRARGVFRPAGQPGTAELVVTVEDAKRASGYVMSDNFGDPSVGETRWTAAVQLDNLTGRADRAELRVVSSDGSFAGRVAYSLPSFLQSGQYYWSAAYTAVRSRYGGPFAALEYTQRVDALQLSLQGPGRGIGAVGSGTAVAAPHRLHELGLEYRRHQTSMLGVVTPWELLTLSAGQSEEWPLTRFAGVDRYSARLTLGYLHSPDPGVLAEDRLLLRSAGLFATLNVSLSWRMRLPRDFVVTAGLEGQWASRNLHGSEKFGLGGPSGVRAYGTGDASGDEGWLARLEVQRPFTEARWTVFAFLDGGAVRKNKRPWRPEEDYSEARAGAGIGLSTPEQFPVSGRVEYAVPIQLTDEAGGETAGRWWVRASWRF